MKLELKRLHSPDVLDLRGFSPRKKDKFGFSMQIMVSELGGVGEESFDVVVCSPIWLMENYKQKNVIFGREFIIMFQFNYEQLYDKILNYVNSIDGKNWDDLANEMSRIGHWEFEGYSF